MYLLYHSDRQSSTCLLYPPIASFQIKFGDYVGVSDSTPSGYQLTAAWQSGLGQSTNVGGFCGVLLTGWLASHFGQRFVIMWSLVFVEAFVFLQFFAPNLIVLTIGEFLLGLVCI